MKNIQCNLKLMPFLAILSFASTATGQKTPMKFGTIEPKYFNMKSYAADSTQSALILGDYGESKVILDQKDGFILEYVRHFRAKIFKKSGYRWANHDFLLVHTPTAGDRLTYIKGTVYNLEKGGIIESELGNDMIHEEVIDSRRTEYKFTLPKVKEGSIIEFTYKIRSPFIDMHDWQFQYTIPVLWSEYRTVCPEQFYYKTLIIGYVPLAVAEESTQPVSITIMDRRQVGGHMESFLNKIDFKNYYHRWLVNDVPPFREEPYMNAFKNYIGTIKFELASYKPTLGVNYDFTETWEKINEQLLSIEDFGLQLRRGGFMKEVVTEIQYSNKDMLNQLIAAYEFTRNNLKWNSQNHIFITGSLRSVFERKSGSSADINMFLVTLLKELGIDCDPVILSTRDHGVVQPAQIMLDQFDYVIACAKIGNSTFLMDATEKVCPYNILPSRCINGQGRIISEKSPGWIDLNNSHGFEYTNATNASISANGIIKAIVQRKYAYYAGLDKRNEVSTKADHDEYIKTLESTYKGLSVTKYELNGLDCLLKPYVEQLTVEISNAVEVSGNIITFIPLLYDQLESNPFMPNERKFPVDFVYPHVYKCFISYDIPEGYEIVEQPADLVMSLPDGKTKFIYRISNMGGRLQVSSTLETGKALYTPEEYKLLKVLYGKIISKQAEKVVLKKII